MITYTFSQARQNFATVLSDVMREGEVLIKRKDGTTFVIRPVKSNISPLDVNGIDLSIDSDEIVNTIREIRER